jgi:hypothetical protein
MRKIRNWIVLSCAVACAPGVAVGQGWTTSGPDKVYALAVSRADGSVWVGTPTALYRSPDHGRSWILVRSFPADVTPMRIAFDQANTMYLALGRGAGVFRSTDGGATLVPLPVREPCFAGSPAFAISPSRPSTVYFSGCGVYRSDDAGATWTSIPLLFDVRCLAVDPVDPQRVLAGTWFNGTAASLFISGDGGAAWKAAASPFNGWTMDLQFDSTNSGRVLAAVTGDFKVGRSDDGGESWADSSGGYTGNSPQALVMDPADPRTLYLGSAPAYASIGIPLPPPPSTGLQVSHDGGATWSVVSGTPLTVHMVAVDPRGEFVYTAFYGESGISIYQTGLARAPIAPPSRHRPSPHAVTRPVSQ